MSVWDVSADVVLMYLIILYRLLLNWNFHFMFRVRRSVTLELKKMHTLFRVRVLQFRSPVKGSLVKLSRELRTMTC